MRPLSLLLKASITTKDEDGWAWQNPEDVELMERGVRVHTSKDESFVIECGRGEWTAKTTADARQMAMDFASSVS